MDLIESWSFKIFAFGTLGHPCGKQASSWDITAHWAETPRGCGKRMAAAEVAQDTNLLRFLLNFLPNPQQTTGRMSLPFASSQAFPPVLPFSNDNQSISLLRLLFFVPLFFPLAPSLFVCFKEFSWRGSFTKGGELSSPHSCKLSRATAPSAAGAWTRLKKNIMGIFNFPVWSWEMKSHHERSLPGAVSR